MDTPNLSRRDLLKSTAIVGTSSLLTATSADTDAADENAPSKPIDIGSRRELFIDNHLVEQLQGQAEQRLHQPVPQDLAVVHDAPWEGTGSGYHSIFQDGALYRMYYKAWHLEVGKGKVNTARHPLYCCYAESDDGISWRKPELGQHDFQGSKKNNIAITSEKRGSLNIDAGHPAVFKDGNPDVSADARYKAIVRSAKPNGLIPLQSPDGLHFQPMTDAPVLTGLGAFDSQNLAFWDPNIGKYRAYWRYFISGRRDIRTAVSSDLIHWGKPTDLMYADSPPEHLYTNQVKPYHRAPHILIGFPTRYTDRGWTESTKALPELEHRQLRASASRRYGTAVTEGLLMASRDGNRFHRWNEAFLPPGIERPDSWNYGHQYIGWHLVETKSRLSGAPNELSLYAGESYWTGKGSSLRRYTLRLDGFVSIGAPTKGGEFTTRLLTFGGSHLSLNFATSAAGSLRLEIQQPDGKPYTGFAIEDCPEHFGNTIARTVTWKNGSNVSSLAGKPVRLRFRLSDANLYSMQFIT